jgi:CheY-like chemotaxis protein
MQAAPLQIPGVFLIFVVAIYSSNQYESPLRSCHRNPSIVGAIALYAEHKRDISVVLLDLMMPSLDSATTIRTLCKLNPQVQIVAMSGLAANESIVRTMDEGVQAFLAKPFTAPELLNLLAPLCGR